MRISWQYPISVMRLLIDKVIYLIQGKLHPDYEWIEVGIAEKMALRALFQSSAADMQSILQLYPRTGDLYDAASVIIISYFWMWWPLETVLIANLKNFNFGIGDNFSIISYCYEKSLNTKQSHIDISLYCERASLVLGMASQLKYSGRFRRLAKHSLFNVDDKEDKKKQVRVKIKCSLFHLAHR